MKVQEYIDSGLGKIYKLKITWIIDQYSWTTLIVKFCFLCSTETWQTEASYITIKTNSVFMLYLAIPIIIFHKSAAAMKASVIICPAKKQQLYSTKVRQDTQWTESISVEF